jgi:uncharacterized protein DUF4259
LIAERLIGCLKFSAAINGFIMPRADRPQGGAVAAWGTGSFENEDATAWLAQLGSLTPDGVTQILVQAADHPDYLESPAASAAVAAAEIVATLNGFPAGIVPPQIVEWTSKNPQVPTPELKALAIRAVERIRRNSELKDLWLQADGLNDWISAIQELQTRLN